MAFDCHACYKAAGEVVRLRVIGSPREAGPADRTIIPGTEQLVGEALGKGPHR